MRWVYLSPHPDDAALCAGGLIFDQCRAGEEVEIWTVMSGIPTGDELTPYARVMHEKWSTTTAQQTLELRREEDRRAAGILGATTVHLDFLDAIYRTTDDGEPLYGDPVGAPLHPIDTALTQSIATELQRRLRLDDSVVCLLGIGNHADHVVVRQAAEARWPRPHLCGGLSIRDQLSRNDGAQAGGTGIPGAPRVRGGRRRLDHGGRGVCLANWSGVWRVESRRRDSPLLGTSPGHPDVDRRWVG